MLAWRQTWHGVTDGIHPIGRRKRANFVAGQFVLETVCAQIVRWSQQSATANWLVAVNVAPALARAVHKKVGQALGALQAGDIALRSSYVEQALDALAQVPDLKPEPAPAWKPSSTACRPNSCATPALTSAAM